MRILIACEYSSRVREDFRELGHDAFSCDIIESDDDRYNRPFYYYKAQELLSEIEE